MANRFNNLPFGPPVIFDTTNYKPRSGKSFFVASCLESMVSADKEDAEAILSNCATKIDLGERHD